MNFIFTTSEFEIWKFNGESIKISNRFAVALCNKEPKGTLRFKQYTLIVFGSILIHILASPLTLVRGK